MSDRPITKSLAIQYVREARHVIVRAGYAYQDDQTIMALLRAVGATLDDLHAAMVRFPGCERYEGTPIPAGDAVSFPDAK